MRTIAFISIILSASCSSGYGGELQATDQSCRSLVENLDRYDSEYSQSVHPKRASTRCFIGTGDESFRLIVNRINSENDFYRYLELFISLKDSGDFDICEYDNMRYLSDRLISSGGIHRTRYPLISNNCQLPEAVYID